MPRLYLRPIGDETQFSDLADYLESPPFEAPSGFEWQEGEPAESAKPYTEKSPLDKLEALISQGQLAMAEAPLPVDIQTEIFNLEVFINNYYRRSLTLLITHAIESFVIPPERTDVTTGQRSQVEGLKTQMLAVFSG